MLICTLIFINSLLNIHLLLLNKAGDTLQIWVETPALHPIYPS